MYLICEIFEKGFKFNFGEKILKKETDQLLTEREREREGKKGREKGREKERKRKRKKKEERISAKFHSLRKFHSFGKFFHPLYKK